MGTKRKANDMSATTDTIKIVADPTLKPGMVNDGEMTADGEPVEGTTESTEAQPAAKTKKIRARSKKYQAVRAKIDKTKKYDPFAAVELVKRLSYSKFEGTITAHVVVKEVGISAALTLPHSTGKTVKVVIVDEAVLKDIADGKINFDILVAAPQFMPKLAKFAPVLGPKGLMPNPKNGTLTPNPEVAKKKLEAGTTTIKTEKKAPLMHIRVGKTSMETKEIVANVEMIIKVLSTRLESMAIAASMSPGVKVNTVERE